MDDSQPDSARILVALLVAVVLPTTHCQHYWHRSPMGFPYSPMVMPGISTPFRGFSLPPSSYHLTHPFIPQWGTFALPPSVLGGRMTGNPWTGPSFSYMNPGRGLYRQWGYPLMNNNHARNRMYTLRNTGFNMQTRAPRITKPTFKAFTKAPVFKTARVPSIPKRKKNRISVMSGPLVDVRPSPARNSMSHHMRKKARFKAVAKAKPFHHLLSGTALGLNKIMG